MIDTGGIERATLAAQHEPPAPPKPVKHQSSIIRFSSSVMFILSVAMAVLTYVLKHGWMSASRLGLLSLLPVFALRRRPHPSRTHPVDEWSKRP